MNSNPKKVVHVAMSPELYEQLKLLADKSGRSVPGYIRQILKYYVQYWNDDLDAQSRTGMIKIPWPVARE